MMGVIDLVRELHGNGRQVVIASDRNALPEMLALGKERCSGIRHHPILMTISTICLWTCMTMKAG